MRLVLGIDEAGRGSVVGPMVVCGYAVELDREAELASLGVADSKKLTPEQRSALAEQLTKIATHYVVRIIPAKEVNSSLKSRGSKGLNNLELKVMSEIISELRPDKVIVDSPELNVGSFRDKLLRLLDYSPELVCENKADDRYPVVSAASIIAKVTRDAEVARLRQSYGDFGSGYPSDPKTLEFIKQRILSGSLPDIVRADWRTVLKAKQLTLWDFG